MKNVEFLSAYPLQGLAMAILPVVLAIIGFVLFLIHRWPEKRVNALIVVLGIVVIGLAGFLVSEGLRNPYGYVFKWFDIGKPLYVTFGLDHLGSLMLILVIFITTLVMLYSTSYMKAEKGYARYFASLFLFASAMIGIVYSFNLLMTFVFWELVGFCSYLLINFWYEKPASNYASRKAFIVNRIGDLGFMAALGLVYAEFGTFQLAEIFEIIQAGAADQTVLFFAGLGIFIGCMGKSAQFPLLVWLPDAMQAPTPVSALLHAATMVAAGIFLLARLFPLFPPDLLTVFAYVGAITSLVGAFSAASQTDIKKILAYSTISQLGYMVVALGSHSYFAAVLHLFTHAMFKACLFLGAGAVIHEMEHLKKHIPSGSMVDFDPQDIRLMGGLRKRMPFTFTAFLLASLASAGVPLSAGFLSKDEILAAVCAWATVQPSSFHYFIPFLIFTTSLVTAFYTGRLFFLVFFGGFRLGKFYPMLKGYSKYIHEAPLPMVMSYSVLSIFCLFVFYSFNPIDPDTSWLVPFLSSQHVLLLAKSEYLSSLAQAQDHLHYGVIAASIVVLSLGFGLAYVLYALKTKYKKQFVSHIASHGFWVSLSRNALYLNQFYEVALVKPFNQLAIQMADFDRKWIDQAVERVAYLTVAFAHVQAWIDRYLIDGAVNATIWLLQVIGLQLKNLQNGNIQSYIALGLLCLIGAFIWISI